MGISVAHDGCYERNCMLFKGISMGHDYCSAFPDGIPDGISKGDNPHTEPLADQTNKIVYEKGE